MNIKKPQYIKRAQIPHAYASPFSYFQKSEKTLWDMGCVSI